MTLACQDVRFGYGRGPDVLRGVSATAGPGVLAVIGPNGSGKSTLLRLLAGLAAPRSGRVTLDGRGLRGIPPGERAARLAYIAQRPDVSAAFSVREVVGLGRYAVGRDAAAVEGALERLALTDLADRPFHTLSAGQQQRTAMARALAQLGGTWGGGPAPHLIADEPTSAMDPAHVRATAQVLREMAGAGACVCVASHDLHFAHAAADRVLALSGAGVAAADGSPGEVMTPGVLGELFGTAFARAGNGPALPVLAGRGGAGRYDPGG